MDASQQTAKKWKLVIFIQVVLLVGLFNPWTDVARITAAAMLALEIFLLVVIALPVFLYQRMVKKKKMSESFQITIDSVLSSLMFGV